MSLEYPFKHYRQHEALRALQEASYEGLAGEQEKAWLEEQLSDSNWLSLHRYLVESFLCSPLQAHYPSHEGRIPLGRGLVLPALVDATAILSSQNHLLYEIGVEAALLGPAQLIQEDGRFFYQWRGGNKPVPISPRDDKIYWSVNLSHSPNGAYYPWWDITDVGGLYAAVSISFKPKSYHDHQRELTLLSLNLGFDNEQQFPTAAFQIIKGVIAAGQPYETSPSS